MTAVLSKPSATPPAPRVTWADGVVVLRDDSLFGSGGESLTARFLSRVFRVEGVISVAIDRARGTASICHENLAGGRAGLLSRLAEAVRGDDSPEPSPPFVRGVLRGACTEYHRGPILPACDVRFDGPGRLRLRIGVLQGQPALAERTERLLQTVPGVRAVSAGSWLGRLLVQYDPAVLPRKRLLDLIGESIYGPDVWTRSLPEPPAVKTAAVNATLGVALLEQFAVPALIPVSALLLVGMNLKTFRTAWLQLRSRRAGLPVLYTAIVVTTLATGQFVSSALMTWFFCYWNRRSRRDLATERHRLLDGCLPLPGLVRLRSAGGAEVLVEAEHVRPGDRVLVSADEAIPVDGRIVGGEAIVDERSLRGTDGATRKRVGDAVLAGSFVLAGELIIAVERAVEQTRAAILGRALVTATSPEAGRSAPTRKAEVFAERAVGPTLATAGVGLLIGDLASVGAILRPDYATGPGVGASLEILRDVSNCARRGMIIRDASVFDRLAQVDLIVLDDHPTFARAGLAVAGVQSRAAENEILRYAASAYRYLDDPRSPALLEACRARGVHLLDLPPVSLQVKGGVTVRHGNLMIRVGEKTSRRGEIGSLLVEANGATVGVVSFRKGTSPEAAMVVRRLREAGAPTFAMLSERSTREIAPLAARLGVNQLRGGLGPGGKAEFLRACRQRGVKTAFVGNCRRNAEAAAEASLTIDLAGASDSDLAAGSPSDVQLLCDRLDRLELLWEIARSHVEGSRIGRAWIVGPNLACVAGAFLFGFTGLTAVAITNLGTFGVYNRAAGSLRKSVHEDRLRLRPPGRPTLRLKGLDS